MLVTPSILQRVSQGTFVAGISTVEGKEHFSVVTAEDVSKVVALTGWVGNTDEAESIANAILFASSKELLDTLLRCAKAMETINEWFGENPGFDLHFEPPWYEEMLDVMETAKQTLTTIQSAYPGSLQEVD